MITKREIKKLVAKKELPKQVQSHHSGKGTKARINTAAEKHFFNTKSS